LKKEYAYIIIDKFNITTMFFTFKKTILFNFVLCSRDA